MVSGLILELLSGSGEVTWSLPLYEVPEDDTNAIVGRQDGKGGLETYFKFLDRMVDEDDWNIDQVNMHKNMINVACFYHAKDETNIHWRVYTAEG